jgi:hypothetical protein
MEADETILIEYVTTNHSQGGDGMNFDHTFWVAAATEMKGHPCLVQAKQWQHVNQNGGGYVLLPYQPLYPH